MIVYAYVIIILFGSAFTADIGSSCVTPNGESATCIPVNSCNIIRKAIRYLDKEAIAFAQKSQCGYDVEDGPLVCCGTSNRLTTTLNEITTSKSTTNIKPIYDMITVRSTIPTSFTTMKPSISTSTSTTIRSVSSIRPFTSMKPFTNISPFPTMNPIFTNLQPMTSPRPFFNTQSVYFTRPSTTRKSTPNTNVSPSVSMDNPLFQNNSLCGFHSKINQLGNSRIAEIAEHPWLAALYYINRNYGYGDFKCSGSLINKRYVLTTAECLAIPGFRLTAVRFGEWQFSRNIECFSRPGQENLCDNFLIDVPVARRVRHSGYNQMNGNNNIGLVRLARRVCYSDFIRPICLPPVEPSSSLLSRMETAGWSLTLGGEKSDIKLKAKISSVSHNECEKVFPCYTTKHPKQFCAKVDENPTFCNRESGIPLMTSYKTLNNDLEESEERWYLEGILSVGFGCSVYNAPSLYTRIPNYINWILNNMEK